MRKLFVIITLLMVTATSVDAQIPVTVTSDMPGTLHHFETMFKWIDQYEQMQKQIMQLKRQYDALTGIRNFGDILNNPTLRNYLPNDWQGVYDKVRDGGLSGLSGAAKVIYYKNQIYDTCARIKDPVRRTVCQAKVVKAATDKANVMAAYNACLLRLNQIDQLMRKINTTTDPKSIAELQARIGIENANIQNEQTKLQMYGMLAAAEDKLQEQRQGEVHAKIWSSRKGIVPKPLIFK